MAKKIILDTNFIIHSLTYKIDIIREIDRICNFEYEISVLDNSLKELEYLKKKLALQIAKTFNIIQTNSEKGVDSLLIDYSKNGYIIATQDVALKRHLIKPIIIIRQKKFLQLQE